MDEARALRTELLELVKRAQDAANQRAHRQAEVELIEFGLTATTEREKVLLGYIHTLEEEYQSLQTDLLHIVTR
jgi:hypothetical protein